VPIVKEEVKSYGSGAYPRSGDGAGRAGGVNFETAPEYIRAGATAVGVGECIFNAEALRQGKVEVIAANGRKFAEAVRSGRSGTAKG